VLCSVHTPVTFNPTYPPTYLPRKWSVFLTLSVGHKLPIDSTAHCDLIAQLAADRRAVLVESYFTSHGLFPPMVSSPGSGCCGANPDAFESPFRVDCPPSDQRPFFRCGRNIGICQLGRSICYVSLLDLIMVHIRNLPRPPQPIRTSFL
jgi:hypothetical protein